MAETFDEWIEFVGSPTSDAWSRTSGLYLTATAPTKERKIIEGSQGDTYVTLTIDKTTYYVVFDAPKDQKNSKYLSINNYSSENNKFDSVTDTYNLSYYYGQ